MKTTGNLGLKKPDGTDIVDITDLNGNMDILDTAVKAVQDHAADTVKHITATERSAWNAKASTAVATTTAAGLMAGADKSKLDSVAQGANNYVHPSTHSPSVIAQDSSNRFVSDVEKTAWNGKANLVTTPQQTTADITYYVRTDGNDGNTGLGDTAGGAFKTWAKAYSVLPKTINHTVNVYIGPGTYPEAISLKGFGGEGALSVIGVAASRFVQRVEIVNCTIVTTIDGFTCTATTVEAVSIRSSTAAVVNQVISTVSATNQSGIVLNLATARLTACVISNKGRVVSAVNGGKAYAENFSGTGNTHGYVADLAGHISYAGTQASSTNGNFAGAGGIVNSEVLNPWGDNTFSSRSFAYGTHTVQQNLSANVLTKIICNAEGNDNRGEYNPATGIFTAKTTGVYLITAAVQFTNVPDGSEIKLGIGSATGGSLYVSHLRPGSSGYGSVSGAASMGMEAGGTLVLWAISTASVATNPDPAYTYVIITQIA